MCESLQAGGYVLAGIIIGLSIAGMWAIGTGILNGLAAKKRRPLSLVREEQKAGAEEAGQL